METWRSELMKTTMLIMCRGEMVSVSEDKYDTHARAVWVVRGGGDLLVFHLFFQGTECLFTQDFWEGSRQGLSSFCSQFY